MVPTILEHKGLQFWFVDGAGQRRLMLTGFGAGLTTSSRSSQKSWRCGALQCRVEAFAETMFAHVKGHVAHDVNAV
jgi:hypothetical protein